MKADTQSSDPRVHCPEERSEAAEMEIINTLLCRWDTIETVFRTVISVHQLCVYGTVSDLCEEYKAGHVGTRIFVLVAKSDPFFVPTSSLMKTPTLSTDNLSQEDLLQKYLERVASLSQQNRVIKFGIDAGFLRTVDVGQYFMIKDTEKISQFTESVACRE